MKTIWPRSLRSLILVGSLLLLASTPGNAMDHREQWGVGGSLGGAFAAPWAQHEFEYRVGAGPTGSAWVRYVPGTPEIGFELSYNYFQLSKMDLKTHAAVVSFFSRQNPWGSFHPFYSFGVGYQSSQNFYRTGDWETPIFKIQAGIEFEMNERLDLGFYFNHYTIFQNKKPTGTIDDEVPAHVLAPSVSITYYFGSPAPMPTAPAPTPVASPVPPPPAPAAPALQAPPARSKTTQPSRKAAPAKKKPVPKKKRRR